MTDNTQTDAGSMRDSISLRKIAHVVGLLVLIAVVLPFVIYAVPQVVGANHGYVVLSGSMEPVMSPGDVVIVDSVDPAQIEEGDIITFGAGEGATPTTHRVIGITEQGGTLAFETKGDANENADSTLVPAGEVQGKVMSVGGFPFVIPLIGHVIVFANTQTGFFVLFAVPVVLFVANEIWNVIAAGRSESEGNEAEVADPTDSIDETVATSDSSEATRAAPAETTADTASGTPETESPDEGITFSAAELQLGVMVLGTFLAYSAWVAYETTEFWSFGVAGGVGAAFLLLGGLYLVGGSDGDDDTPGSAAGASGERERSEVDVDREMNIVTDGSQPPGRTSLDESAASSGPVEFARGVSQPDASASGAAAATGRAEGGESDD